jgi:hypothetical protein
MTGTGTQLTTAGVFLCRKTGFLLKKKQAKEF